MSPELEEKLRENYRKNFLALILYPQEMMEEDLKELRGKRSKEARESKPEGGNYVHRTPLD